MRYIQAVPEETCYVLKIYSYMGILIETKNEGNKEFLCIVSNVGSQKLTLEKFSIFLLGLYYTKINIVE